MQQQPATADILARFNIEALNDMQLAASSAIPKEQDVLLLAPTGSGKTLGFLLPVLKTLKPNIRRPQCLILLPSRELALQTQAVWKQMGTGYSSVVSYGGHLLQTELNNFSDPPALIIGTPGRVMDHIVRGSFELDGITTLVLDEFDKSLALGFADEMSFVVGKLTKLRRACAGICHCGRRDTRFCRCKKPYHARFHFGH